MNFARELLDTPGLESEGVQLPHDDNGDGLPPMINAEDFLANELPTPPELIGGILHQGSKLCIGGGSKSFKTWILLDMALSVASGRSWLNFKTDKGCVLYVNFELANWSVQRRLTAIKSAKGIANVADMTIWNLRGHAADFATLLPKIGNKIKQDFALVILDPLYKLYGGLDENRAGDVARLMNGIESLAVDSGAAVSYGQHFSKGNQASKESIDRVSGSGVFARDPDSLLTFTRLKEPGAFSVEATLRNFPPVEPFAVRWQHPVMVADATLDPAKLKQAGGRPKDFTAEDLLNVLGEQSLTSGEWKEQAKEEIGVKDRTFYNLLSELQKLGRVLQSKVNRKWTRVSK